jgi:hypothetical protein
MSLTGLRASIEGDPCMKVSLLVNELKSAWEKQ